MNQDNMVLKHLEHKTITSLDAIKLYGITRLSAVIWRLRHEQGLDIRENRVKSENRYGRKVAYSEYYLVKGSEEE